MDININGIPNLGFAGGGGGYFGGIPNQQPAMSADQINASMWGRFLPGMGQAALDQNFNNFGVQTDYYSRLGAAYGRATGGFGATPAAPAGETREEAYARDPSLRGPSVFDTGTDPVPYVDPDAARAAAYRDNPSLRGPGASFDDRYSAAPPVDYNLQPSPAALPRGIFDGNFSSPAPPPPPVPTFESRWGGMSTAEPWQQLNQNVDQMYGFGGAPGGSAFGDVGSGTSLPGGYMSSVFDSSIYRPAPPSFQERFAPAPAVDPGSFANRWGGMGDAGRNAGTPSQYYTGGQHQQMQLPPSYSGVYSVDNPGGALPLVPGRDVWGPGGSYQPGG